MFMIIPYPSGLAVYIFTQGVVGIVQQWYLNRTHPHPRPDQAHARQEIAQAGCEEWTLYDSVGGYMTKEFVREGKLDREAAAEALRDFLRRIDSRRQSLS